MKKTAAIFFCLAMAIGFAGCTVYEVAPGTYAYTPRTTFDRSWAAALGAFDDQGIVINHQDRESGEIRGTRSGVNARARLYSQADGSVRVEINSADTGLAQSISAAYNRRMGR